MRIFNPADPAGFFHLTWQDRTSPIGSIQLFTQCVYIVQIEHADSLSFAQPVNVTRERFLEYVQDRGWDVVGRDPVDG
jgi:hypothetical protein